MNSENLTHNAIEESEFEIGEVISFDDVNDYELEARINKQGAPGVYFAVC